MPTRSRRASRASPRDAAYVLVHDAARPLVPPEVVDRVVAALRPVPQGVVPALPLADTVKRIGADGSVAETLERAALRAVQTPQGFPAAVLRDALAAHAGDATDCASMVERHGPRRRLRRGRRARVQGDDAGRPRARHTDGGRGRPRRALARAEGVADEHGDVGDEREHTVETHVARILMMLDLRDRTQAVVLAYESGLVRPGSA